jgi:predicted RNA-binding protein with PUA-like domain
VAYWLLKTEAEAWSWEMQVQRGDGGEVWSGVRNPRARNNLLEMKLGDRAFFYHTGSEKRIVGTVEVIREAYPDPTDHSGRWAAVTVKALAPLKKPVTLAEAKADPRLREMALVKQPRLSVQPVSDAEWKVICQLGELGSK